jgi:flagellar basal body rod protein FlgC
LRHLVFLPLLLVFIGCSPNVQQHEDTRLETRCHEFSKFYQTLADNSGANHRDVIKKYIALLKFRLRIIRENIDNADVTVNILGKNIPYRRRIVTWDRVGDQIICDDQTPFVRRFAPGHPLSDSDGYFLTSNVETTVERIDFAQTNDCLTRFTKKFKDLDRDP